MTDSVVSASAKEPGTLGKGFSIDMCSGRTDDVERPFVLPDSRARLSGTPSAMMAMDLICGYSMSSMVDWYTEREEAIYETADAITVPSGFAAASFIEQGIPREKLHVIPYGVRLDAFRRVGEPPKDRFEVLFVCVSVSSRHFDKQRGGVIILMLGTT